MKTPDLILRCYATKRDGHWEAFCIDLCLAAQDDTLNGVKARLNSQIYYYVEEALTVDRQHADYLLNRKAPIENRIEYALICFRSKLHFLKNGIHQAFKTILPVHVGNYRHA